MFGVRRGVPSLPRALCGDPHLVGHDQPGRRPARGRIRQHNAEGRLRRRVPEHVWRRRRNRRRPMDQHQEPHVGLPHQARGQRQDQVAERVLPGEDRTRQAGHQIQRPADARCHRHLPHPAVRSGLQARLQPNHIASHTFDWTLPEHPKAAKTASCANMGPIGVLDDGVMLENALDGQGGDAAAHEVLDVCAGHPDQASMYHHHDIPPCILRTVKNGETKLVGYALDGFGIRSAVSAAPRRVTGCRPRPRRAERPRSEAERRRAPHR
jgi:hypothetical protein